MTYENWNPQPNPTGSRSAREVDAEDAARYTEAVKQAANALKRNRPAEVGLLMTVGPWVIGLFTGGWGRYSLFSWMITTIGFIVSLIGFSLSKDLPGNRGRAMAIIGIIAWAAPVAIIVFAGIMLSALLTQLGGR